MVLVFLGLADEDRAVAVQPLRPLGRRLARPALGRRSRPLEDVDFRVEGRNLVFERPLRKDRISGVRYEAEGELHVAHALAITMSDEESNAEG